MKSMLVLVFSVLVTVAMQGCETLNAAGLLQPQVRMMVSPEGQAFVVQSYQRYGVLVSPASAEGARVQADLIKASQHHEERMTSIEVKHSDLVRNDQISLQREKNKNALNVIREVASAFSESAERADEQRRYNLEVLRRDQPKPQGYRQPEVRRQERVTVTSPAPQRQKVKVSAPQTTQRQPRQVSVPQRQSATSLPFAPAKRGR